MENASKALIIAAAILISIMIISLGIWAFSIANNASKDVDLDEATIASFNQNFKQYEGTRISGNTVKSLIDAVRSNNIKHVDDKSMQVAITGVCTISDSDNASTITSAATKATNTIENGSTYKVAFSYAESGLIETITITKNN